MPPVDPGQQRANRALGGALGVAGACAAGYGAVWSGHAQSMTLVTVAALVMGGGLGALTWGLFEHGAARPVGWFSALFAGVIGMLAGAFAGFPLGAVFGAGGGGAGGLVAIATWRLAAPPRTGWDAPLRGVVAGALGMVAGLGVAMWMAS